MFHEVFHRVHNAAYDRLRLRGFVGSGGENDRLNGERLEVLVLNTSILILTINLFANFAVAFDRLRQLIYHPRKTIKFVPLPPCCTFQ